MTTTIMTAWERCLPFYTSHPLLSFKHVTQLLQTLIWMWTPCQCGWELHILPGIKESVSQMVVDQPSNIMGEEACSPKGSQAYGSAMGWDGRKTERKKKVSFKWLVFYVLSGLPLPYYPKWAESAFFKRHLPPQRSERPTHWVPSHQSHMRPTPHGGEEKGAYWVAFTGMTRNWKPTHKEHQEMCGTSTWHPLKSLSPLCSKWRKQWTDMVLHLTREHAYLQEKQGEDPVFSPVYSPLIPLPHRVLFNLCHSSCFRETEAQAACFVHPIFKISIAFCFFRSSQAAHKSVDAPYVAERGIGRRASECWQRSSNSSCYFNAIACSWKWKSFSVSSSLEENFSF